MQLAKITRNACVGVDFQPIVIFGATNKLISRNLSDGCPVARSPQLLKKRNDSAGLRLAGLSVDRGNVDAVGWGTSFVGIVDAKRQNVDAGASDASGRKDPTRFDGAL